MHLTTDEKYQSSRIKTTLDVVWFKKKSWPSVLAIQMRRVYWCGRFRKSYWCLPFFLQRPRPSPPLLPFLDGHWFPSSLPLSAQKETDAFSSRAARKKSVVSYWTKGEREGLIKKGQLLCRDGWWWQSWIVVPQCDQLEVHQHRI